MKPFNKGDRVIRNAGGYAFDVEYGAIGTCSDGRTLTDMLFVTKENGETQVWSTLFVEYLEEFNPK